jgi:hypothetical protein
MKRNIISVVVGIITAGLIFTIVETINMKLHAFPSEFNHNDKVGLKNHLSNLPLLFWALVLFGWAIGSFTCGLLARAISKSDSIKLPLIAGAILTLTAVINFLSFPHPTWFVIVGLVIFIPMTLFGFKVKGKN